MLEMMLMKAMLKNCNDTFIEEYEEGKTDREGFELFIGANFSENPHLIKILEIANKELVGENDVGYEYVEFFINKIRELLNKEKW